MAGLQNVLIVEDDVMIQDLYRTTLVRDGYHVEIASDSNEAYGSKDCKIMMLTNLAQKNFADSAFKFGANEYIVKADILPNDLKEIISSIGSQTPNNN